MGFKVILFRFKECKYYSNGIWTNWTNRNYANYFWNY